MKQKSHVVVGGLAAVGMLAMSACASSTQASGSLDTIAALETQNYVTLAPVTSPTTAPAAAENASASDGRTTAPTEHTVKAGEGLAIIAKDYDIDVQDLLDFNGFDSIYHTIHPGDVIKIPAGAKVGEAADDVTPEDDSIGEAGSGAEGDGEKDTEDGCTYTIKAGDIPYKVAEKVGISYEELQKANASSGVLNTFLVGDKLFIPPPGEC